jgi:hypothetical protein
VQPAQQPHPVAEQAETLTTLELVAEAAAAAPTKLDAFTLAVAADQAAAEAVQVYLLHPQVVADVLVSVGVAQLAQAVQLVASLDVAAALQF